MVSATSALWNPCTTTIHHQNHSIIVYTELNFIKRCNENLNLFFWVVALISNWYYQFTLQLKSYIKTDILYSNKNYTSDILDTQKQSGNKHLTLFHIINCTRSAKKTRPPIIHSALKLISIWKLDVRDDRWMWNWEE